MNRLFSFFLLTVLCCGVQAQGILNTPLPNTVPNFEFAGAYLGFQAVHATVDPLYVDYDRVLVLSSGFKWRRYVQIGGEVGLPVYRANNVARKSYFLLRVDLRLL